MSEFEAPATSLPADLPFAEALELAGQWLAAWDAGELSDEVLADRVGALVSSRDGARGFFVVALTGASPLMDRLPEPLLLQLRLAGPEVVDLTARNLAMSTAMALAHGRSGDGERQLASERVQSRSRELLRQLDPAAVKLRLETLLLAARDGQGDDLAFLDRWGYDGEQRAAIAVAVNSVAEGPTEGMA
ncbi:MAG: hypothetical protein VKJ05_01790 [Synechococcaceae cyanobacterium]|nr:hypothetical protein [Synechococcaceae cyanobacterium]